MKNGPSPLILAKADAIRTALAYAGIVSLGVPETAFADLPDYRKAKWIAIAEVYCDQFCR